MTVHPEWEHEESLVQRLAGAVDIVAAVAGSALWRLTEGEVEEGLCLVGRLRGVIDRLEVTVVREGIDRGLPAGAGMGINDWVRLGEAREGPQPDPGQVAQVVRVAQTAGRPAAARVCEAFEAGHLGLAKADLLARFEAEVTPVAGATAVEGAMELLVPPACDEPGSLGLTTRELKQAIRYAAAHLKPEREREREEEAQRCARALFKRSGPAGMSEYRLLADPEAAAIIDAAVSALSAPVTEPDGTRDQRSPARRRADALVAIVSRGVSAPGAGPRVDKAQVVVTIPLEALLDQLRGAGVTMTGEVLSPETVRRLACDAGIVPMVLGSGGEVLDVGRIERLFSPAQRKALWRRDGGCTYPGCTIPAQWCDAHHVVWWARGGRTDLRNGALLCPRHHTLVHAKDLTATVDPSGVTWHLDRAGPTGGPRGRPPNASWAA